MADLTHISDKVEKRRASIPASLPSRRAKTWDLLFGDEVVLELVGSVPQNAQKFPSIANDFKAQQQWTALGDVFLRGARAL